MATFEPRVDSLAFSNIFKTAAEEQLTDPHTEDPALIEQLASDTVEGVCSDPFASGGGRFGH